MRYAFSANYMFTLHISFNEKQTKQIHQSNYLGYYLKYPVIHPQK